jgi:methylmalonyl-CoA mutase N-terminal domain/subunit
LPEEVGKTGVAIDSLKDIEDLFDGIPLDKPRQVSTTANSIRPIWVALLLSLGEKQGVLLKGIISVCKMIV